MNFDQAIDKVLGHEGGYSRHPDDPGGETCWGITARVAIANGYKGPMIAMPRAEAVRIYKTRYWDAIRGDDLPEWLRFHILDAAVNSGVTQAVKWLQRALDVGDDGVIGPVTLKAAQTADRSLLTKFYADRLDLLSSLPTWGSFGRGWARRLANNMLEA